MRVLSSILFALMAVVLPMAGVQQYFCTMTMAFVEAAENCPVDEEKSCCEKETHKQSEAPICMTAAKLLPNADLTAPAQIPAIQTDGVFQELFVLADAPEDRFETVFPLRHRGPPDLRRMYVVQRRLLI